MSDEAIQFQAQVFKIQTLIDGGLRLTLDLGAVDPAVIVALFDAKQPGVVLEVAAVAIKAENFTNLDENEIIEKEATASPVRVDRRRLVKQRD